MRDMDVSVGMMVIYSLLDRMTRLSESGTQTLANVLKYSKDIKISSGHFLMIQSDRDYSVEVTIKREAWLCPVKFFV